MNIFRMPSSADSTGDAIPLYHDGTYHIFSLTPPKGTTVYPARLRTSWSHTISDDLVHWQEVETALYPGEGSEPDACGVWTGAALFAGGQYHIFYTGYNPHIHFEQSICHATSADGLQWKKDPLNPIIVPDEALYEVVDWRDPYVFYNEDDRCYWMLISGRIKQGPPSRRGVIVLYRSQDLTTWAYYGPIYQPYHTNCPECAEMYKLGDNWYLSYSRFSEFVNTIYRVAKSPFGPWRTPKYDGIGGRRFYAAKSLQDKEDRRIYFAWAHDRAERSDTGEWYWGGVFCIPHEVRAGAEGNLDVKMPDEYLRAFDEPVGWQYKHMLGSAKVYGDKLINVDSVATMTYGFFEIAEPTFLFRCKIRPHEVCDHFGILLKSDDQCAQHLLLCFDIGMQRVSLLNLPMGVDPFWEASCTNIGKPKDPGPDGVRVCEKPYPIKSNDVIDIKIVIDHDMIEIFVGERVAFTYRSYAEAAHDIGILVQDGVVEYYDIAVTK